LVLNAVPPYHQLPYKPLKEKAHGSPYKGIRSAFKTVCKHAKLRGVTAHTQRYTFANRLATAGVDLGTIQELGGWRELEMLKRYAHLSPSIKKKRSRKLPALSQRYSQYLTNPAPKYQVLIVDLME
jgi:integrase